MTDTKTPAVWFPAVRSGSGADVFTERLAAGLRDRGLRAEITWLPLRAEYAPWTVAAPEPPNWANLVHINSWLHSRFVPKDRPVVATIHHAMHHPAARAYKGRVRSAYHQYWIAPNERRVLRRANKIVAVSRFVAETARQTLLDAPMDVIYNGVDADKFKPSSRQRKPHEPLRLLYVGSWKKMKGVDLLAPIMQELGEGFELHYTGGAPAEQGKARMPSNMHDLGRLQSEDAVVAAMQDADALLFPSRSEGHPLVVIEAMACGLPVVATRGSSLVEAVADRVTGVLCTHGAVNAFAEACRELARTPALRASMATEARECAATNYSIAQMIDSYIATYEEAFESSALPRRKIHPPGRPQ